MKFKRGQKVVCVVEWDEQDVHLHKIFTITHTWKMGDYQLIGCKEFPGSLKVHSGYFRLSTKLDKALK